MYSSLPLEIWYLIFEYIKFSTKVKIKSTCKYLYKNLDIIDFYNIDDRLRLKLNNKILSKYKNIQSLDISNNPNVTNIYHLKYLKFLNASGSCELNTKSINKLNLTKLILQNNDKITNINKLTKLEYLDISNNDTNLKLDNLKKLKILKCSRKYYQDGINNKSIKLLNLKELDITNNQQIYEIDHMQNLEILHANGKSCVLNDHHIRNCINLKELYISDNPKIITVNHLTNLKVLDISQNSGVNHDGIKEIKNLDVLNIKNNFNINEDKLPFVKK